MSTLLFVHIYVYSRELERVHVYVNIEKLWKNSSIQYIDSKWSCIWIYIVIYKLFIKTWHLFCPQRGLWIKSQCQTLRQRPHRWWSRFPYAAARHESRSPRCKAGKQYVFQLWKTEHYKIWGVDRLSHDNLEEKQILRGYRRSIRL